MSSLVPNRIDAHRALVNLLRLAIEARDVKRAAADTVLTADALFLIEVDDAVLVLDDRARRGACKQAARILAVQTGILPDEPRDSTIIQIHLVETHEVPRRRGEVLMALVS